MSKFSVDLWESIEPIFQAILSHPFIEGLTSGALDKDAFRFYVTQDSHYLREFARMLALCGAKGPNNEAIQSFCEHAAGLLR